MRLIDNEVETIRLLANGICQCIPNGILSGIRALCKVTALAELLSIQEIDVTVLKDLAVEGIVADGCATTKALISFGFDFEFRLLVKLRRVREPNEDGIILVWINGISIVDCFNQRSHYNRFTGAGRSSIGNDLRSIGSLIVAERHCCALTKFCQG